MILFPWKAGVIVKKKFNELNKLVKILIIFIGVLIVCTILYFVCFDRKYNNIEMPNHEWNEVSSEIESSSSQCNYKDLSEDNYCKVNEQKIIDKIVNVLNNTLIYEYFPEDINYLKENYELGYDSCDNTCYVSDGTFGLFTVGIKNDNFSLSNSVGEFNKEDDIKSNLETIDLFEHAKGIIKEDYLSEIKKIDSSIEEDSIGTYPVYSVDGLGRYFVIEIRDYKTETDNSGKLYITYTVDLKEKTYTKVIAE